MAKSWREIRQSLEYTAVRGALALAARLPIDAGQRVGAAVGWLAFDVARLRRSVSVDNIVKALGVSEKEATRIARAAYMNSGRCLLEFSAFARLSPAEVLDLVAIEGRENLEGVLAQGKGGIIVAGHLGNWELCGAVLAAIGTPINFLVGQQTNARVDDTMNDLRRKQNIGIIKRSVALRGVMQALASNQIVAILPDQDARKNGVMIEFLGRPASTVRGPAVFAIRRGCAVLPMFIARTRKGHVMTIEPPLYSKSEGDEEERIRELTQRYTDRIAARVRRYPHEYFWGHRRWKTQSAS
jgi:KDO2-lipid IV(A) lauroyltransferase